jgi:serine/threonine-protein kinase
MKALGSGFWKADWFLGVVIVVLVMVFNRASDLIPSLERKAYDLGVRATSREPAKNVTIIAIDEESLEKIGRWPWSREVLGEDDRPARGSESEGDSRIRFLLSEPQVDPGYQYIVKLLDPRAEVGGAAKCARRPAHRAVRDCPGRRDRRRATGLLRSSRC